MIVVLTHELLTLITY